MLTLLLSRVLTLAIATLATLRVAFVGLRSCNTVVRIYAPFHGRYAHSSPIARLRSLVFVTLTLIRISLAYRLLA